MTDPGPSSPRIAPVVRTDGASVLNIFQTLAHNKDLRQGFIALGSQLLMTGRLAPREREIVILRVGWLCGSEYEFGQHTSIGRDAGLNDDEIATLADCGNVEWRDGDADLIALANEICTDNVVSEPTWQRLSARYDDATMLELLVLAGYYRLVSGMLNSAGVALEPGTAGWPDGAPAVRHAPRTSS